MLRGECDYMKNHIVPKIILMMLVMFILRFGVAPALFDRYFPSSNEAGWIFLSTITVFSLLKMLLVSDKILH